MNMIVKNKKLLINNQVYRKSIPAPTREELLNPEEREYIQSANLVMSGEKREKGNVFIAYAANIANVRQARAIYRHVKTKHIDSTHVVGVHCLEGEMPTLKDYSDNGEYGAGARILGVIEEKGITQVAVFLVRYHGQNLGMRRFDIFTDLAGEALDKLTDPTLFTTLKLPKPHFRITMPNATWARNARIRGATHSKRGAHHTAAPVYQHTSSAPSWDSMRFEVPGATRVLTYAQVTSPS